MKRAILLLILVSLPLFAAAETTSFDVPFKKGLEAAQTKVYDEAQSQFHKALRLDPRNTAAMSNLAYTYTETQQWGLAIAWYRRALTQDPGLQVAREGLEYSLSQLEVKEIPHRIETFETLRTYFLQYVSLSQFLGFGVLFLLVAGWRLLSWWGARKRALREESSVAPPPFSFMTFLFLFLFVMSIAGALLKIQDLSSPRGTIVAKKVDALSAPGSDGVSLFELHEGFEVLIGALQGDWVQVTYPGGLTGWIPRRDLIPLGGEL